MRSLGTLNEINPYINILSLCIFSLLCDAFALAFSYVTDLIDLLRKLRKNAVKTRYNNDLMDLSGSFRMDGWMDA